MLRPLRRRELLASITAAGAASLLVNATAETNGESRAAPTTSAARARLLPGCCAYSYGKYLKNGSMTMEQFIVQAVELGVLGVEITTYWLKSTEQTYLATLRRFAQRQGMPISGLAIGAQMCQPDAVKRKEVVGEIEKWVDATEHLGASHLRVFGDTLPPGATEAQGVEWVAETMKESCEYSGKKGITLGLETHMGLTLKASNVTAILHRVDSPFAGCTLDISNFHDNPYEQIEACLPYATNSHIRDYWGEAKTPLDLDRVWQMFAQQGFKGYMSAEYEAEEDPKTGVPKLVEKIKTLCRKYSSA
jgi:sugar phosphate isomerase/epimerase